MPVDINQDDDFSFNFNDEANGDDGNQNEPANLADDERVKALIAEEKKKWEADASRFLQGQQGQSQQQQQNQPDPLLEFAQDPAAFVARQTAHIVQQQQLVNDAIAKNPLVRDYEEYVAVEVQKVVQEAKATGQYMTPQQALDLGVERFTKKFNAQAAQQAQQGQFTNQSRQAMRLDVGGGTLPAPKKGIWDMSEAEFEAYDRKVAHKLMQS